MGTQKGFNVSVVALRRSLAHRAGLASLLVAFGLGFGVVFAEAALRLMGAGQGSIFTVTAAEFERVPGIFTPGLDAVARSVPELPYHVRINSLGYRGNDFPLRKPPGEFRILYVGDSFVFGPFVEDQETMPAQLSARLEGRCDQPILVVNAGLGGSTITEQIEIAARGAVIEPDLMILQFHNNDLEDLAGTSMWDVLARNRQAKSRFPLSLIYPLVRGTALWELASRAIAIHRSRSAGRSLRTGVGSPPRDSEVVSADSLRGLGEIYATHLAEFRDATRDRDVDFVMTVFPSHLSVYDGRGLLMLEWLDSTMVELGIDGVSFLQPLVDDGRSSSELYLLPYDGHASPAGNAVAANALANALITSGKLGDRCR